MSEDLDARLDRAWGEARARGLISGATARVREHAGGFMLPEWRADPPVRLADLGSGAGVPGLVLADWLSSTSVTLIDSNERRCELAWGAVRALSLEDRVAVVHARAEELARRDGWREAFDAVVARLFGPPPELAECGIPLLSVHGRLVTSVNAASRAWWETAGLRGLGARHERSWSIAAGSFVAVLKERSCPGRYPRRPAARRRDPGPAGWTLDPEASERST